VGGTGSLGCYRHPDRPTGIACARCGRPICPECMIPASVGFQCPACVREGNASVPAPRRGSGLQAAGRRWGAVTLTLIAINVAMFLITAVSAATTGHSPVDNSLSPVFASLSQWPYGVILFGEWWRVFTAAFLHIGPVHLAMNMLALLLFGSELERQLGRSRYLVLYLLSALGGATVIQLLGDPRVPVAGASAAIYGLLGALGVLMLVQRQDLRGLFTLLAINVFISFLPGVSLLGHVGGLVAGALTAGILVLTRRRRTLQIGALAVFAVALLVVSLTVPTVAVLNL
jgi:membrane associated rhomboid family serine protease